MLRAAMAGKPSKQSATTTDCFKIETSTGIGTGKKEKFLTRWLMPHRDSFNFLKTTEQSGAESSDTFNF